MAHTQDGDIPQECLRDWVGQNAPITDANVKPRSAGTRNLNRTIESEIIPRLMMLFDQETGESLGEPSPIATKGLAERVDEFVELVFRHDAEVAAEYISKLRSSGVSLQTIYLDLLAPTARRLGVLWETDQMSFTMVTIAVARMHQVLLQFSPCFRATDSEDVDGHNSAVIVPVPGEQHTFGLFMAVEFFRRGGWNVWSGTPDGPQSLIDLVRNNHFDMIGFSVSSDRHLDQLAGYIRNIRAQSRNAKIKVLLGGRIFAEQAQLHEEYGADAAAVDGEQGVRIAESLVS